MDEMYVDCKAPPNKYRVVGIDTFPWPWEEYLIGDFDTLEEAKQAANEHGGVMSLANVYGEGGAPPLYQTGTQQDSKATSKNQMDSPKDEHRYIGMDSDPFQTEKDFQEFKEMVEEAEKRKKAGSSSTKS